MNSLFIAYLYSQASLHNAIPLAGLGGEQSFLGLRFQILVVT
jgi:hypothetical protein